MKFFKRGLRDVCQKLMLWGCVTEPHSIRQCYVMGMPHPNWSIIALTHVDAAQGRSVLLFISKEIQEHGTHFLCSSHRTTHLYIVVCVNSPQSPWKLKYVVRFGCNAILILLFYKDKDTLFQNTHSWAQKIFYLPNHTTISLQICIEGNQ